MIFFFRHKGTSPDKEPNQGWKVCVDPLKPVIKPSKNPL